MRDLWNFSLFGRGNISPKYSETCRFVSGSWAKLQISSRVLFFFVYIGHCDNVLAGCDASFPLLWCQGVWNKMCTQISLYQILFHIRRTTVMGMFKDFADILDAIQRSLFNNSANSNNVYISSSWFWTANTLAIFYQLPSISKSKIQFKNVSSFQNRIHISLCTNASVTVADRPAFEKKYYDKSLFISAIHDV